MERRHVIISRAFMAIGGKMNIRQERVKMPDIRKRGRGFMKKGLIFIMALIGVFYFSHQALGWESQCKKEAKKELQAERKELHSASIELTNAVNRKLGVKDIANIISSPQTADPEIRIQRATEKVKRAEERVDKAREKMRSCN